MVKRTIAVSTIFMIFLVWGGIWISLTHFLPAGIPRTIVIIGFGGVFVLLFLWMLISQIRQVLGGTDRMLIDIGLIGLNLGLLLMAFGWMYQILGIVDTTQPGNPVTNQFSVCVYYSIVTFTTLGYGDFQPQGPVRVLAAMQALTGYLILGILASTGATLLSPREEPHISKG